MPDDHPLASAEMKLVRARKHRKEAFKKLAEAKAPELRASRTERIGESIHSYVTVAPEVQPLLDELGGVLGDVFHNYRCVLDHIAYALAEHLLGHLDVSSKVAARIQFEIFVPGKDPFPLYGKSRVRDAPQALYDFIAAQQVGARPEPDLALYLPALNVLDNLDKHRAVRPAVVASREVNGRYGKDLPNRVIDLDLMPGTIQLGVEREVARITVHGLQPHEEAVGVEPVFEVLLPDIDLPGLRVVSVTEALGRIDIRVERVLRRARTWLRETPGM